MTIVTAVEPAGGWDAWSPEPGNIYVGLPEAVYHKSVGISKHGLDNFSRAPAYYAWHKSHPRDDADSSEALIVGSAIDVLIFEPDEFDKMFIVEPEDFIKKSKAYRNTKWYKEWVIENQKGRSILRAKQWDEIRGMRDAVAADPWASALLADGIAQPACYWVDDVPRVHAGRRPTYRLCRNRLDWLCEGHSVIVDLKSAAQDAARFSEFERHVHRYRYHVQASFYMAGIEALGHKMETFVFLVVEKEPPHLLNIFPLEQRWHNQGRVMWEREMELYHWCKQRNEWPGYGRVRRGEHDEIIGIDEGPRTLPFPPWAEREKVS